MSETIEKAIQDLRERRDHLRHELEQVERALAGLEGLSEGGNGSSSARGDQSAITRFGEDYSSDLGWQLMDRTKAIRRVLKEAGAPMKRMDLVKALNEHGRPHDTPENVSATLSYLKPLGQVRNPATGMWAFAEPADGGEDAPTEE